MNILRIIKYVAMPVVLVIFTQNVSASDSNRHDHRKLLDIIESSFSYESDDKWNSITTLGKLKNSSEKDLTNIVIEVDYFDANNILIDTYTVEKYSMVVPSNETVSFRLRSEAAKDKIDYSSHKVVITSAKPKVPCRKKDSLFKKTLISWTPLLILIAIWVYFLMRTRGKSKKSYPEIMEELVTLTKESNEQFAKIADSIEKLTKKDEK